MSGPSTRDGADGAFAAAVRAEYARAARAYARRWAHYVAASVGETLRRLVVAPGERVLDVGCGTGALLAALRRAAPGAALTGADPSAEMLAEARAKGGGLRLAAAAAEALPFPDGAFDVVVTTSAVHFWSDPAVGLGEAARVLRPGGRLVLTDWCRDYRTVAAVDRVLRVTHRAHRPPFTARACAALVEAAGFAVDAVDRYRIDWLWGLMTVRATRRGDG